jgi:hypothetical protein
MSATKRRAEQMGDPIDFNQARRRGIETEAEAERGRWGAVRDNVVKVLVTSGLSNTSVTSAAVRALMDVLKHGRIVVTDDGIRRLADGMSRYEAAQQIASYLRGFDRD